MRSIIFAAFFATLAVQAHPAEIMDGYDAGLGKGIVDEIVQTLVKQTSDPYSAQIIGLHRSKFGGVCALVNLKNSNGAYTGFQPYSLFLANKTGRFTHDPECDPVTNYPVDQKRLDVCYAALDQYLGSSGTKAENETRSCLTQLRHRMYFALGLTLVEKARLPLAKEFK